MGELVAGADVKREEVEEEVPVREVYRKLEDSAELIYNFIYLAINKNIPLRSDEENLPRRMEVTSLYKSIGGVVMRPDYTAISLEVITKAIDSKSHDSKMYEHHVIFHIDVPGFVVGELDNTIAVHEIPTRRLFKLPPKTLSSLMLLVYNDAVRRAVAEALSKSNNVSEENREAIKAVITVIDYIPPGIAIEKINKEIERELIDMSTYTSGSHIIDITVRDVVSANGVKLLSFLPFGFKIGVVPRNAKPFVSIIDPHEGLISLMKLSPEIARMMVKASAYVEEVARGMAKAYIALKTLSSLGLQPLVS